MLRSPGGFGGGNGSGRGSSLSKIVRNDPRRGMRGLRSVRGDRLGSCRAQLFEHAAIR